MSLNTSEYILKEAEIGKNRGDSRFAAWFINSRNARKRMKFTISTIVVKNLQLYR